MNFNSRIVNKVLIVTIDSAMVQFSNFDVDEFFHALMDRCSMTVERIAIDLSAKQRLNSSDLGFLIKLKDMFMDNDIGLVLINPSEHAEELFHMVGLGEFFVLVKHIDELTV